MITALETNTTTTNGHLGYSISIGVTLGDEEQFLVEIPVFDNSWSSQATQIGTRKVRVERLNYSDENNQVRLSSISFRGFCKDGTLRVRDEGAWVSHSTHNSIWNTIVKAIPTHYHDYAIKKFNELVAEAEATTATLKQNGVKF